MKFLLKLGLLALLAMPLFILAACGTRVTNASSGSSTPVPTPLPTSPPTVTPSETPVPTAAPYTGVNPFEVILNSQYEVSGGSTGGGPSTTEIDCVTTPGTPSLATGGTASTCNPIIPEGRLYFSNLTWTINVGTQDQSPACEIVTFQPYYYQASNAAGFLPSWETAAIDCSTTPTAIGCFSGAAVSVVPNFPLLRALWFAVSTGSTQTYTATSANFNFRTSNRWTVNDLALASYGTAHTFKNGRDAYLANTFVNYQFNCNDRFMQPVYTVNMTIFDEDIVGVYPNVNQNNPAINQYPDWDPLSWDY
jgi:hypothetical protein